MASGLIIELGAPKKKNLASEIASSIPSPSKLRKSQAMQDPEDSSEGGNAALESAVEVFSEAVKRGDAKAGAKAFKLMVSLCDDDSEYEDDDNEEDEE